MFRISMRGYAINHKRGIMVVVQIIKNIAFPLDSAWKYDPDFIIGKENNRITVKQEDHDPRSPEVESL